MNTSDPAQGKLASQYLKELDSALAASPRAVRDDIVADIAGELRGLSETAARERIARLGDPRAIAADAVAEERTEAARGPVTKAYPTVTAVVLTAGWYVVPVFGWIAGLIMIGVGERWTGSVKRTAILVSTAGAVVSSAAFILLRGLDYGLVGLAALLVVPLITNIFVSSYLRARWN